MAEDGHVTDVSMSTSGDDNNNDDGTKPNSRPWKEAAADKDGLDPTGTALRTRESCWKKKMSGLSGILSGFFNDRKKGQQLVFMVFMDATFILV